MCDFLENIKKIFFEPHHCRCICKSKFDIRIPNARVSFPGAATGTLSLKGAVCPKCDEDKSSFTIKFRDNNLADGNNSFVFKTCTVIEALCSIQENSRTQQIFASGIYNPKTGPKRRVLVQLTLNQRSPGDDLVSFTITDSETGDLIVFGRFLLRDEGQIRIEECDK